MLNIFQQLRDAQVPLAAFWLQDWTGLRVCLPFCGASLVTQNTSVSARLWWNWELDEQYYSNWTDLCALLAADNVRVMTYINPYLANNIAEYKVAI